MAITTLVELRASIADFEAKMAAARAEMAKTAQHGESTFGNMSKAATVGLAATAVAVVGVGVKAVEMAAQFQTSMERLHTQAGVPQAAIEGLSKGVLNLAGQVGFAPNNLAEALFHVESSFASTGISGQTAMEILKTAAQGAAIGGANLVDVTNALDAAIASGIPGVENFGQAMGALNAIVGAGDMKMQDLAEALGSGVLAVVKNYGLSLTDVGAALATFGDNNIRGAQAATFLRMAVQAIAVPAKAGQQALSDVGMTADQMAKDMQNGGLITALEDLKKHFEAAGITGNRVGEEITTIFGKRAGSGVAVLYDQLSRMQSKVEEIQKGANQFDADWKATQATFTQQWKNAVAGVEAFMVALGSRLLPVASQVLKWLTDAGGWLGKHKDLLEGVARVIGAVLVPALIVWGAHQAAVLSTQVLTMIGQFAVQIGNLAREMTAMGLAADIATGPFGMIAAAIGAVIVSLGNSTKISKDAQAAIDQFTAALSPSTDRVTALKAEFDKLHAAQLANIDAGGKGKIMVDGQALSQKEWEQRLEATGKALTDAEKAQKAATEGQSAAKKVQDDLNLTVAKAPSILGGLTQAEKDAADAAKSDKIQVTELKDALDALIGIHLNAEKATIAYNQSIDALTKGIVKDKDATNDNSAVGQANITMIIDAIEKAKAHTDAIAAETGNVGAANKMFADHVNQLLDVLAKQGLLPAQIDQIRNRFDLQSTAIGITTQAVAALTWQYGQVPTKIATDIVATLNLDPTAAANAVAALAARVAAFQNQLRVVSQGLTPTGGAFAAGGITSGPTFLAGEGNPAHPEYVIPTDPMYRANAVDLFKKLGKDLHLYAAGGIVGDQAGAAGSAVGLEMLIRRGLLQQSLAASAGIADNINAAVGPLLASLSAPFSGGGGVARWAGVATQVANMLGQPGSVGAILRRIQFESGGDPFSVNRSDINFLMGFPSVGLAQVIGPTFAAYAGQFRNVGPFAYGVSENPLANVYAGMNYATNRYGSIAAVDPRVMPSGYDGGGWLMPGMTLAYNGTGRPERVLPPGGGGVVVNLNIGNVNGVGGAQQLAEIVRAEVIKGNRGRTSSGF